MTGSFNILFQAKEKKQTLPTVNPEDVLLLEESEPKPVKSSKIEVSVREVIVCVCVCVCVC